MLFKKDNLLMSSLYLENKEISKLLIKNNINLLIKNKIGDSPLDFIKQNKMCDLIEQIKFKFEKNEKDLEKIYTKKEIRIIKEKIGLKTRKKLSLKISKPFIPKNIKTQEIKKIKTEKIDRKILKEDINSLKKKILEIQKQNQQIIKKIEKIKEIDKNLLIFSFSHKCIFENKTSKSKNLDLKELYYNLGKEIKFFSKKIFDYQTKSEKFYDNIYKNLKKDLKKKFPNNVVIDKGGSYKTGLRMPWSNLNITVSLRNLKNSDKKLFDFKRKIREFYFNINESNKYSEINLKETQSLIILSFNHKNGTNNTQVEILFKYYINTYFPSNENIIINYLNDYSEIKNIFQIFRFILKNFKIDSPVDKGLNNICIMLIVVYFFQNNEINKKISKEIINDNTRSSLAKEFFENIDNCHYQKIGKLLIDFFAFYNNFDFNKNFILTKINNLNQENKDSFNIEFSEKDKFKQKKDFLVIFHPHKNNIILSKSFKNTLLLKECFKFIYVSFFSKCFCSNSQTTLLSKRRLSSKKNNLTGVISIKYQNNHSNTIRSYCNLNEFKSETFRKCSMNINTFLKKYEKNNNILSFISNKENEKVKKNYLFNLFYYNQEKPL